MWTIYHTLRQDMSASGLRPRTACLARRLPRKPADRAETLSFPSLSQIRIQTSFSHYWAPLCAANRHTELRTIELAREMRTDSLLSAVLLPFLFRLPDNEALRFLSFHSPNVWLYPGHGDDQLLPMSLPHQAHSQCFSEMRAGVRVWTLEEKNKEET